MLTRRWRALLLLVVATWSSACFAYQDVGRLPDAGKLPADVRIYRYDGQVIQLARSSIAADTIRGFAPSGRTEIVVPLAHVDSMHFKQFQARRSAIATAVTLVAFVGVIVVFGRISPTPQPPSPPTGF